MRKRQVPPEPRSSGIIRRRVKVRTFDDFADYASGHREAWSASILESTMRGVLAAWERIALDCYRRNGLPYVIGPYVSAKGRRWRRMRKNEQLKPGLRMTDLHGVAKDWPADTEVGFATEILERCSRVRLRLSQFDDPCVSGAFLDAALTLRNVEALRLEYGLANVIGTELAQRPARSAGGSTTARRVKAESTARHALWQRCAEEIWREPGKARLSKRSVARLVVTRLKERTGKCDASLHTIRQVIKKT